MNDNYDLICDICNYELGHHSIEDIDGTHHQLSQIKYKGQKILVNGTQYKYIKLSNGYGKFILVGESAIILDEPIVIEKKKGYTYCNKCGGFGKHRLMCPFDTANIKD